MRRGLRLPALTAPRRRVPLRNRVTPFGEIIATPARGLLFGNRGIIHDDDRRIVRPWQVRRWIACRLAFKDWYHEPMRIPARSYTGLFFLDEATSLAAGHRPCAECRHADFIRFRDAFAEATGTPPRADDIDRVLHAERLEAGRRTKRTHAEPFAGLPDGTFVAESGHAWLVLGRELLAWSPSGYGDRRRRPRAGSATVLTPASTVSAIRTGYEPAVHPTAIG